MAGGIIKNKNSDDDFKSTIPSFSNKENNVDSSERMEKGISYREQWLGV